MPESVLEVRWRLDRGNHEPAPNSDHLVVLGHLLATASLEVHLLQRALVVEEHVDGTGLPVTRDHNGIVGVEKRLLEK